MTTPSTGERMKISIDSCNRPLSIWGIMSIAGTVPAMVIKKAPGTVPSAPVHLKNLFVFRHYYSTIAMRKVIIKNAAASPAVILLRKSSTPFFLPSSVWAPPAMAPDNPAAFPDCMRIVTISPRQTNASKIIKMVFNKLLSPLYRFFLKSKIFIF